MPEPVEMVEGVKTVGMVEMVEISRVLNETEAQYQ